MASVTDYLKRSLLPSTIIAASRVRMPRVAVARAARLLGRPIALELYFAFDDPYAAIAVPQLFDSLRSRPVSVSLYPLVRRGIANDPAQHARTRHALTDARRLAQRDCYELQRSQPLAPQDSAFLAAWTTSVRQQPAAMAFAGDALNLLWRDSDGPVEVPAFEALYRTHLQEPPPPLDARLLQKLQQHSDRLYAKGHWESPAVRIAGEWFFAHERQAQIESRLDELCA